MTPVGRFFEDLSHAADEDAQLDVIYGYVDQLMWTHDLATLNQILSVDVSTLSSNILVGLLSATLPVKDELPQRALFLQHAETEIKVRGEWEEGLLNGLA